MQPRHQLLAGQKSAAQVLIGATRSTQRTYATSAPSPVVKNPLQRRRGGDLGSHLPKHVIPSDAYIPAYPYGDHALFKQANRGLYGEQKIQFGNNVSHKTETKTRRNWKPNVLSKSLYSVALKKRIKLRITSKVLKTMDREGGLDEYLLKDNEQRLKEMGPLGWALRWTVMQKPEIIARLRSEAAALGLDQATIDRQWPTREMLAAQKNAQKGLVRAADLIGEEYEQYDEVAEEGIEGDESSSPVTWALTKQERRTRREAGQEYAKAVKAAHRYLNRGIVDSEEEGLKLAFVRANDREEARLRLKQNFTKKVDQQFTSEDLQEIRTRFNLPPSVSEEAIKRIAYNQWRREQIEKAGSYEAWREALDSAKSAARSAAVDEAGGKEAFEASRKAMYAKMIEEAETASTNMALDIEKRTYLEQAIHKADRAIKATHSGGQDAYVEAALEELRQVRAAHSMQLNEILGGSSQSKPVDGDAWAALVNSANKPTQNQTSL